MYTVSKSYVFGENYVKIINNNISQRIYGYIVKNAQQGYFYGEEGECRYEETLIQTSSGYQALRKKFGPLSGNRTCFAEIACGESDEYEDFDEEDKNSIVHIMVRFHISGDEANFCYHKIPKETKVEELVSIGGISFENYVVLKDGMILSPRLKLKYYKSVVVIALQFQKKQTFLQISKIVVKCVRMMQKIYSILTSVLGD